MHGGVKSHVNDLDIYFKHSFNLDIMCKRSAYMCRLHQGSCSNSELNISFRLRFIESTADGAIVQHLPKYLLMT